MSDFTRIIARSPLGAIVSVLSVSASFWTAAAASAQDSPPAPQPDKSEYHLFNPTPPDLRREISADRPDTTESPYTVDAGAVQVEFSFFDYAKNGDTHTWMALPINLKLGLTNDIDFQVLFDPFIHEDRHRAGTSDGVGDTTIRLKMNLWGNDSGPSAGAVMPFVKAPTASDDLGNDHVEAGVVFAFGTDLGGGFSLGAMIEPDFVYDEFDDDYDVEFLHTAVVGMALTDVLSTYVEGAGVASTDTTDYRALVGTGLVYAINENTLLDFGVNIGLTGDADDFNIFSGMTIRF